MKSLKKILVIIILILMLLTFTGCEEDSDEIEKEKALSEIEYIEEKIISIVENYLTEDYTKTGEFDWNQINDDFEEISNSASTVIIDLTSLQVDDDEIMEFENRVNNVNSAISNEAEIVFLECMKNLYELIPNYTQIIFPNNQNLYLEKNVKLYLMETVYYCVINDFETAINYMEEAETIYKRLIADSDYMKDNSYVANKIYVAIQEMKLAVQNQKIENVISKYVNTN